MSDVFDPAIALGEDAERFMASDVGRYVMGCAEQEVATAVNDLVEVADVGDTKKIREIQLRMAVGTKFRSWITELLNNAREARELREHAKPE